jgi:ribose transport system substrate-binding protein
MRFARSRRGGAYSDAEHRLDRMRRRAWLGTLPAVAAAALLVAACGSDSKSASGGSAQGGGTKSASSGSCDLPYVKQQLSKYGGYPTFTPPGQAIDVSKLRGKTIYDVPLSSSIQFVDLIDQQMKKIAGELGINFHIATNQGQQSQFVQGMNQAVAQKADAIILSNAPDPKVLQPQIVQAKNAKIPTISTHWYDVNDANDTPANVKAPNLAADVPFTFTTIARLEADWAIQKSNCKAHTVFIYASDSDGHKQMNNAFHDELTTRCGSGCSVTSIGLPFSKWPTRLQSDIQAQLSANPNVNWVIPDVDFGVQFAVPAINGAGKGAGQVKVATFNGTPSVLKQVRDGQIVDMDIGENLNWNAYADLDQTMRVMLGTTPVTNEHTPIRIFSKDNIGETGDPPGYNKGWGTSDFAGGYRKLWGVG